MAILAASTRSALNAQRLLLPALQADCRHATGSKLWNLDRDEVDRNAHTETKRRLRVLPRYTAEHDADLTVVLRMDFVASLKPTTMPVPLALLFRESRPLFRMAI